MNILDKIKDNISGRVVKPLQRDLEETDWGSIDTVIKVDPPSIVLIGVVVIVVAITVIYVKKSVK